MPYMPPVRTVTIANGETVSGAVVLAWMDAATLVGLITPAGWTTADITFQGSLTEGGTYYDLKTVAGVTIKISAAAADSYYVLDPADLAGVPWLKLKSSASQSGVDIIQLVVRSV